MKSKPKISKKGFTITEIIVTLVILGIVLAIAIPGVGKLQESFKRSYYEELNNTVIVASKTYYKDKEELRPTGIIGVEQLEYRSLVTEKYLDIKSTNSQKDFVGYNDNEVCSGKVVALKLSDENIYINCMQCKENTNIVYATSLNDAEQKICALTNNYKVEEAYNETPIYLYSGVYDNQILKEKLKVEKTSSLYETDAAGQIIDHSNPIYSVSISGEEIYPKNISSINLSAETIESGKNTGKKVTYSDNKTRNVHIFKYQAPKVEGDIVSGNKIFKGSNSALKLEINSMIFKSNNEIEYPNGSSFAPDGSTFSKYQYYDYVTSSWKDICVNSIVCNLSATEVSAMLLNATKIKFRVVGTSSEGTTYYGKETIEYNVEPLIVTVNFNLNGVTATQPSPMTLTWKQAYGTLPTISATGYDFIGWFKEEYKNNPLYFYSDAYPDLKTAYGYNQDSLWNHYKNWGNGEGRQISQIIDSTIVNETNDHTLYAGWVAKTYTLTYDVQGGSSCSSVTAKYATSWGTLCTPSKSGYIFNGWYTGTNGTGNQITASTIVTGDLIVYAKWTPISYTISYNSNGGSGSMSSTSCSYGTSCTLRTNSFTRSGYEFIGWATSSSGNVEYTNGQPVNNLTATNNGNVILYAVWGRIVSGSVASTCKTETLAAGIYYIEIVGGGAGGLGQDTKYGGNAARWAGYVQLPAGTTTFCGGTGSAGLNGGVSYAGIGGFFFDLLFGTNTQELTEVKNGNDSYIQDASGNKLIVAAGGKSHLNTPYTNSTVTFASGVEKKRCNYVAGKKCASGSSDESNCAQENSTETSKGYGIGGGREYNGGSNGNGYAGTDGIVNYKYITSTSNWNSSSTSCPSTPTCSVSLCKWENWPSS